ncbi:MAG: FHA domain-containing protein [Polyangia bacterium]
MTTGRNAPGGFLSRLFGSADLVRALEAEAGGDYVEAARLYANAGDRAKVAQMHLLASERARTPLQRIEGLREAVRWAEGDDPAAIAVRRRVATAMLAFVRVRGLVTDGDRALLSQAAALFASAGDAAGAGQCHELLGASEAAADAYQAAGDVELLEQLLDGEASRRRRAVAVGEALEDHRMRLRAGDAGGALASLEQALLAVDPQGRAALQRDIDELAARRLPPGTLRLRTNTCIVVAAIAPVELGRELGCALPLRDAGVSRRHARLEHAEDGWYVTDLGSKNGTTLDGLPVGRMLLSDDSALGIGELCTLSVRVSGDRATLTIERGLDRGTMLYVSAGGSMIVTAKLAEGSLRVRFEHERSRVGTVSAPLRLNGIHVTHEVEPLAGDVLECAGQTWQVVR